MALDKILNTIRPLYEFFQNKYMLNGLSLVMLFFQENNFCFSLLTSLQEYNDLLWYDKIGLAGKYWHVEMYSWKLQLHPSKQLSLGTLDLKRFVRTTVPWVVGHILRNQFSHTPFHHIFKLRKILIQSLLHILLAWNSGQLINVSYICQDFDKSDSW